MPQDIKIWKIIEGDKLDEIPRAKLNLEERLENWIEEDISIISNDLLIIGRQIDTDFSGIIDLLCIDYTGDLVVVELKRDKTPREITAQALDYASWVKDLSNERITDIADSYLEKKGPLEVAFKEKFGNEIPDILNQNHKMLIVASEIDSSSERIIKYLSDSYGVGINATTFQYFKDGKDEYLGRVFLIEPSEAEYRIQTKTSSKRKPPLTFEELQEIADKNHVGVIYADFTKDLSNLFDSKISTRSTIGFIGIMGENKSRLTIFSLVPEESSAEEGTKYQIYTDRFSTYFGIRKEEALKLLPNYEMKSQESWAGEYGEGYFKSGGEIERFVIYLRNQLE